MVTTPPLSSGEKRVTSYDEASKFFDRPLSDAADSLGACPSILKKICYDNGLLRWPYRKVLSGKTIEEIKKEAAMENKQLAESIVSVALHSSPASSSISSQPNGGSLHESLQSRTITPQPSKDNQTQTPQSNLTSTMNKENAATSDEFKYGFPSDGLSSVEYRWWGNKCETQNSDNIEKNTVVTKRQDDGEKNKVGTKQQDDSEKSTVEAKQETDSEKNNAETKQQDDSEKNNVERNQQDDSGKNNAETNQQDSDFSADVLPTDEEMKEHKSNEKDGDNSEWANSLSCMRKKAAKEARNAKKLGVYRQYGAQTLNQAKRSVLVQIFKSSLPSEWGDDIVN